MATDGLNSGVGAGFVKSVGTIALAVVLTASATLALVVLVQLWPDAATAGTAPASRSLDVLTYRFSVTPDVNLILLVAVAGALGGFIHALRSMAWYAGNRALKWSWVAFYVLLVPVSALMAVVFYLVLRAGLVSTQGSTAGVSPYGVTAIAALVGLFSSQAAEKLKQVFETLLTKAQTGKDHTPSNPASITGVSPNHGPPGTSVTIRGRGLSGAIEARFGTVAADAPDIRSDTKLNVVVPKLAESGPVTVVTPQGSATSAHFTVEL
jgi:hypothetical protein